MSPRSSNRRGKSGRPSGSEHRGQAPKGLGGEQVEGRHAVRELLAVGRRKVRTVYVSNAIEAADVIDEIVELAGPIVRAVPPEKLAMIAKSDSHQGVVALTTPLASADLDELLTAPEAFVVAIDGVTDPGNLGAILRSASAFGATGIVLPRHRGARITPAVSKAAAGAVEHLAIAQVSGIASAIERAARHGVWTVGLAADGATEIDQLSVADASIMLVVGSEDRGLSRLVEQRCDVVAQIPIAATTESLNASVAAAIACHEIARKRRNPTR